MADEFKKSGLLDGLGENDEIERWITVKGNHVPIKKGQTPKQAIEQVFGEKKQPRMKKSTSVMNGLGESDSEKEEKDKPIKESEKTYKNAMELVESFRGKPEGTYDYNTGELVNLTDGYMVTFHQNEPDKNGHYKSHYGRYTAEEYDKLTNEFVKENGAEVFVGVFDNEPEISFKVKTIEQAEMLAVKYNQKSFWKNAEFEEWDNLHYDVKGNPMRGD